MAETVNLDEHIDYAQYYLRHITKAKRTGDNLNGLCPFHDDHQASFGAELKTGKWKCLAGCGQGNVVSFHARINQTDTKTAFKDLCRIYHISSNTGGRTARNTGTLDPSILDSLEPIPPAPKNYLIEKRGWSQSILQEYRIGYSRKKRRYTIPIFDERGDLVNIRCYAPEKQGDKVKSWAKGYGQSRLYPLSSLKWAIEGEGLIILCEGEPDCLCGLSHGLMCITQTAGAETWKDPFNTQFKGLNVLIAYDNDQAGKDGAQRVARHLPGFAESVEILRWPEWMEEKEDLTDWFVKYGKSAQELLQLPRVKAVPQARSEPDPHGEEIKMPAGYTAAELLGMDFPEPIWIVRDLIPEGTTVLAGKPKLGKSWFGMGLSIAVACGGKALGRIDVDQGDVLYLALEDGPRRLKKRLLSMLQGGAPPSNLHIKTKWPKLDAGGLTLLHNWMQDHPETRLIIIDTLAKIRPKPSKNSGSAYDQDYDFLSALKSISDGYNMGLLVVHHLRKAVAEDPLEQISGSMGISGSVDTALILQRSRGKADATLLCTGRDIEEVELALQFDKSITTWCLLGSAEEYKRSQEQAELIEFLKGADGPLTLSDILKATGKQKRNANKLLDSLIKDGQVIRVSRGRYTVSQKILINSSLSSPCSTGSLSSPGSLTHEGNENPPVRELQTELGNSKGTAPVPFPIEDSCGFDDKGN